MTAAEPPTIYGVPFVTAKIWSIAKGNGKYFSIAMTLCRKILRNYEQPKSSSRSTNSGGRGRD